MAVVLAQHVPMLTLHGPSTVTGVYDVRASYAAIRDVVPSLDRQRVEGSARLAEVSSMDPLVSDRRDVAEPVKVKGDLERELSELVLNCAGSCIGK